MANYRQDRKYLVWENRNIGSILPEGQLHYLQHETQFLGEEQTQKAQIHSGDNKINTGNFFEFHWPPPVLTAAPSQSHKGMLLIGRLGTNPQDRLEYCNLKAVWFTTEKYAVFTST